MKIEYGRNRYHNMSEEKKQRLKEYQRNYREAKETSFIVVIKPHFKIASTKKFFISASINSVKDKIVF